MAIIKKYYLELGAALVISILLLLLGIKHNQLQAARNETQKVTLAFERYKVDQQVEVLNERQRRINAIEEVDHAANKRIQEIQAVADSATADVSSLREQNARLRAAANTAATGQCKAENERIIVYTVLSDECSAGYIEMARIAEESRARGLVCESAYEALRK